MYMWGNHLTSTTRLTRVFLRGGESCSNYFVIFNVIYFLFYCINLFLYCLFIIYICSCVYIYIYIYIYISMVVLDTPKNTRG